MSISPEPFADRLTARVRAIGNPLCAGLDPHLAKIPPVFCVGSMHLRERTTAPAVGKFLHAVLDRLNGKCAVVKPQIAFFEQLGPRGMHMLEDVMEHARRLGFLIVLDAKRGDIGTTAEAYAAAYLAVDAPMACDALTVNPYLGLDSLEPFALQCAAAGKGIFVLVKTSNPGSGDLQDKTITGSGTSAGGRPLFLHVAESLAPIADRLRGASGWSSLGIVAGATYPDQAKAIRAVLPNALFLVPGYGAQGGSAADAVAPFVRSGAPGGMLEGGIVNSSRGILFPKAGETAKTAAEWEKAVDAAITQATDELGAAIR
jgi:orotidine-5'-phosphate decarboxylase